MFKALFGRIWPYVAVVGAVLASLFAVRQSGKAAGKQEVEQRQIQEALDSIKTAKDGYEKVARMGDDRQLDEFERLHDLRKKKGR